MRERILHRHVVDARLRAPADDEGEEQDRQRPRRGKEVAERLHLGSVPGVSGADDPQVVADPHGEVEDVGDGKAQWPEERGQKQGAGQKQGGHGAQLVVVAGNLAGRHHGEGVALAHAVHGQEDDVDAVRAHQRRPKVGAQLVPAVRVQQKVRVGVAEGQRHHPQQHERLQHEVQVTRGLPLLAHVCVPPSRHRVREVEVGALLQLGEEQPCRDGAQVGDDVVHALIRQAHQPEPGEHVLLALRQQLLQEALLEEAEGEAPPRLVDPEGEGGEEVAEGRERDALVLAMDVAMGTLADGPVKVGEMQGKEDGAVEEVSGGPVENGAVGPGGHDDALQQGVEHGKAEVGRRPEFDPQARLADHVEGLGGEDDHRAGTEEADGRLVLLAQGFGRRLEAVQPGVAQGGRRRRFRRGSPATPGSPGLHCRVEREVTHCRKVVLNGPK